MSGPIKYFLSYTYACLCIHHMFLVLDHSNFNHRFREFNLYDNGVALYITMKHLFSSASVRVYLF